MIISVPAQPGPGCQVTQPTMTGPATDNYVNPTERNIEICIMYSSQARKASCLKCSHSRCIEGTGFKGLVNERAY